MTETSGKDHEFDVAVSLAGEDRAFVEKVVRGLRVADVKVFYDRDEQAAMWGENLVDFLGDVYGNRARYAIIFVSEHYARKVWPNLERQNAQARALQQMDVAYVLPVRLDETDLPGMPSTIGYLDGLQVGADGVVRAFLAKRAGQSGSPATPPELLEVPETPEAIDALVKQKPAAWEYILYAALLRNGINASEEQFREHQIAYAPANGKYVSESEFHDYIQQAFADLGSIPARLERALTPQVQEEAFGLPGEPGDADRIKHLARMHTAAYRELLAWSAHLRGTTTQGEETRAVLDALARYADQPLTEMQEYSAKLIDWLAGYLTRDEDAGSFELTATLTFEIDEDAKASYEAALDAYRHMLQDGS